MPNPRRGNINSGRENLEYRAVKNLSVLKNGLPSQVMGGKSRKRPVTLNLCNGQQVNWETQVELLSSAKRRI